MATRRIGVALFVGVMVGAAAFSTLQARQVADRAAFQSLQIVLPVTDINRSVEFYRTLLEFEPANVLPTVRTSRRLDDIGRANAPSRGPDRAVFSIGGQELALDQGLKEGPRPDGIRLIVHVANPGEYAARLRARGVAVDVTLTAPDRQPGSFTVIDPDGYRFNFIGNLALPRR